MFKNTKNEIYFKSLEYDIIKSPFGSPGRLTQSPSKRCTQSPNKMGTLPKSESKRYGWIWKYQKYTEFLYEQNYLFLTNYNYATIAKIYSDKKNSPNKYNSPKKSPKKR